MIDLYEQRPKQTHGTSLGLLIPNEEEYWKRLHIGAHLATLFRPQSVLDVGCGYADLETLLPGVTYSGIDATRWVVEEARRRHPGVWIECIALDGEVPDEWVSPAPVDVVVALGVLATTPQEKRPALAKHLKGLALRGIVVSWLETNLYSGRLLSVTEEEVHDFFGQRSTIIQVPGEPNRTAAFPV